MMANPKSAQVRCGWITERGVGIYNAFMFTFMSGLLIGILVLANQGSNKIVGLADKTEQTGVFKTMGNVMGDVEFNVRPFVREMLGEVRELNLTGQTQDLLDRVDHMSEWAEELINRVGALVDRFSRIKQGSD